MRLVIAAPTLHRAGGIESYLELLIGGLDRLAHQLFLVCERSARASEPAIQVPDTVAKLTIGASLEEAFDRIKAWNPDLVFAHGPLNAEFEARLLELGPAAYFVHNYYGTCISGMKTHRWPRVAACSRTFGPACLGAYLPRRCGGSNPLTMISLYREETARLERLRRYSLLITHSEYMRQEYLRHGFSPERLHAIDFAAADELCRADSANAIRLSSPLRLLFVGRLERAKGAHLLVQSLSLIQSARAGDIELTIAGDGPERRVLQRQATKLMSQNPRVHVHVRGWLGAEELATLFATSHLLVMPCLWPEPFGKVGPEAGSYGLPAVAFEQGGIPSWLHHEENGILIRNFTARGLVEGIISATRSPDRYTSLRTGALAAANRFRLAAHLDQLTPLLQRISRASIGELTSLAGASC
jgi:glycosyltransferase involved in cell wall biosynthesis